MGNREHYGIWPTPLIDVTSDLRTAASFAGPGGYVLVLGLPNSTASISYDGDAHLLLARLAAIRPPGALRAHIQAGFLVGRHPLYALDGTGENGKPSKSDLLRRLVAVNKLSADPQDGKSFFDFADPPKLEDADLYPEADSFAKDLKDDPAPEPMYSIIEKCLEYIEKNCAHQ